MFCITNYCYPSLLSILVVDDSNAGRLVLKRVLERNNYYVVEAADGVEAMKIVRRMCPDLIAMDLNLPRMDGLAATKLIRQSKDLRRKVPILAITAYDRYGMREAALEAGCDHYLTKPLDLAEFERVVRQLLAG